MMKEFYRNYYNLGGCWKYVKSENPCDMKFCSLCSYIIIITLCYVVACCLSCIFIAGEIQAKCDMPKFGLPDETCIPQGFVEELSDLKII